MVKIWIRYKTTHEQKGKRIIALDNPEEKSMDVETYRRRLQNLSDAELIVKECVRKHVIGEYLPGQVMYNLGEYPKRESMAPTEYDRQLLSEFAEHGVGLIQFHEEWNDSQRCLGADKFSTHDPKGLKEFISLIHKMGMKILLYVSTGMFETTDPDFKPSWTARPDSHHLIEMYWDYAKCSPASPEWCTYVLRKIEYVMDEYGPDGVYNDLGYLTLCPSCDELPWHPSHVSPGLETSEYSAALEDLLLQVMNLVRKRDGIVKMHVDADKAPPCKRSVYDYLHVGEAVKDADMLRKKTCHFEPYIVPCIDLSRSKVDNEDDLYLHSVPYMQFALRCDGRPCTGERALVESINYDRHPTRKPEKDHWLQHWRSVYRYYQEHPDAPPMYSWYDTIQGRPEARGRWFYHLDLYRPMVVSGSHVWIDISYGPILKAPKPECVTASLFVNTETYLVLANYSLWPVNLAISWTWKDRETGQTIKGTVVIPPRDILFLERVISRTGGEEYEK